jgi:hypothetical protein
MKNKPALNLNKYDAKTAIGISASVLIATVIISCFISLNALAKVFYAIIDLLSNFSLTFLGFLLTAFTFIQILQSKEWFTAVKNTNGFDQMLVSFKVLILGSMVCFLAALLLKIATSLICSRTIYIIIISLSVWAMSFLVVLAWKTVAALIELFKA